MLCHETQIDYKKYITECTNSYHPSPCLHKVTRLSGIWYLPYLVLWRCRRLCHIFEASNIFDLIQFDIFYNISTRHRSTTSSTRKPTISSCNL